MSFNMPDMPPSFAAEMGAALEADGRDQGIEQSAVDEAIADMFASAGVEPEGDTGEPGEEETAPAGPPTEPGTTGPEPSEIPLPPGGPLFDDEPEPAGTEEPGVPPGEPPAPPAPAPGPQPVTLPDGRVLTPEQLAVYAELDRRVGADPALRQGLADLVNRQAAPQPDLPPLPQLSEEDLESPAIRALIMIADRQRQEMSRLYDMARATQSAQEQQQSRDHSEIVNGAVSAFQRDHNLPDELMGQIRNAASRSNAMQLYMEGVDPQTGAAVRPDPYKAVEAALEVGYWQVPAARRYEFERQSDNRASSLARRQKLAGIGGTSGSGPRQEPAVDTSTQQGRDQAAVAMLSAAMFGENEGEQ